MRPVAKLSRRGVKSEQENDREMQLDMEEKTEKTKREKPLDDISTLLDSGVYVINKTFPGLGVQDERPRIYFSRYYIQVGVCFDMFSRTPSDEDVERRRKFCSENGLKYTYTSPERSMADVHRDLGGNHGVDDSTD